jgi:hypothetical protein
VDEKTKPLAKEILVEIPETIFTIRKFQSAFHICSVAIRNKKARDRPK